MTNIVTYVMIILRSIVEAYEVDFIHTNDDFVSEIWFYSSDRIDGNTPVRDACAVSKLTESQLIDFDYSETMARFKELKIMKDNGMRGN